MLSQKVFLAVELHNWPQRVWNVGNFLKFHRNYSVKLIRSMSVLNLRTGETKYFCIFGIYNVPCLDVVTGGRCQFNKFLLKVPESIRIDDYAKDGGPGVV